MFLSGSGTEFSEKNMVNRSCGPFISPYEGHHRHKNYQRRQSQVPGIPLRNKQIQQMNANDNSKDFCWRNPLEIWWRNLIWWRTIKFSKLCGKVWWSSKEFPLKRKEMFIINPAAKPCHAPTALGHTTPHSASHGSLVRMKLLSFVTSRNLMSQEPYTALNGRNIRSINSLCFPTERDGKIKP